MIANILWVLLGFVLGILYVYFKQNRGKERVLCTDTLTATQKDKDGNINFKQSIDIEADCVVEKEIGNKILLKVKQCYIRNNEFDDEGWRDKMSVTMSGWYDKNDERITRDENTRKKKIKDFLLEIK